MTDDEPTLFGLEEGKRLRDEALVRVDKHADVEWKDRCDEAIRVAAFDHPEGFTTDEVWEILNLWDVANPREPRAMGARMKAAQKARLIVPTDGFRPSRRPVHHAYPNRVWRRL